jgi:lipopolysaccharide cholinephosphotransferase
MEIDFNQIFPDEREKGETRVRQCHLVLLRMLKIFNHLCSKHQIEYFLCSGTLKGAIIYKGFKPWDDDLDIGMTRSNYEKFVELAVPELPEDIFFQTPETDPDFPPFNNVEAKLRDKYSSYIPFESQKHYKQHMGIMMDLLIFDKAYLPNNFFIFLANRTLKFFYFSKGNKKRADILKWMSKYAPFNLAYASSFISYLRMVKLGANYFKKEELSTLIKIKFEDIETYIPIGWHSYLKRRYGNYLIIPPIEKQKGHHGADVPDPFTPCNHVNVLQWNNKLNNKPAQVRAN